MTTILQTKKNEKKIENHFKHIQETLYGFIQNNKIPNILLYGNYGSGKKTLLNNFLNKLYNTPEQKRNYIMYINCAHGKGIKFIRDELKFFARTNIVCNNSNNQSLIKSVVLLNADKLTIDAQSALRRCIELFSLNTRFFIIIEDKQKLLKPILSRFCDIYVPDLCIENKTLNLYNLKHNKINASFKTSKIKTIEELFISIDTQQKTPLDLFNSCDELYEKGISGLDIIEYLEDFLENNMKKYEILIHLNKIRNEYKQEKLFILTILNIYILRNEINLENICKM
jgi:DNA polymerase III delta prime subunit